MKAILMSIRPEWVAKILNGEKTIEVRKRFPSDYVGWVYIYVTSHKNYTQSLYEVETYKKKRKWDVDYYIPSEPGFILNGKVVARFWCDKVEKIRSYLEPEQWYMTSDLGGSGLLEKSCLSFKELDDYLLSGEGYAIHITKLKIFDKPKEIKEFKHIETKQHYAINGSKTYKEYFAKPLTRAPESWQYIEVDL